jgi:hypothetical protein
VNNTDLVNTDEAMRCEEDDDEEKSPEEDGDGQSTDDGLQETSAG